MRPYMTLVRREVSSFFVSPIGYLILAGVTVLLGMSIVILIQALEGRPYDQPFTEVFYNTGLFWLILLIASPIITMRSFAQEKHTGTYETMMTTPVSDLQVVLAKFTGSLIIFLFLWAPLFAYPFLIQKYATSAMEIHPGPLATTFLGILCMGMLYVSLGLLSSSVTHNQLVAAINAFSLGMALFLLSFLGALDRVPDQGWWGMALEHISLFEHMRDFSRGVVDTRHLAYYATLTSFFLWLTLRVVESRRWK